MFLFFNQVVEVESNSHSSTSYANERMQVFSDLRGIVFSNESDEPVIAE
jgi:hypothetical protein